MGIYTRRRMMNNLFWEKWVSIERRDDGDEKKRKE
jgi:hypothetical protein